MNKIRCERCGKILAITSWEYAINKAAVKDFISIQCHHKDENGKKCRHRNKIVRRIKNTP